MIAKTKPKCNKGTACGYACISGKKQCSERIKARDAAELLKAAGALAKDSMSDAQKANTDSIPKGYDRSHPSHKAEIKLAVPPDTVEVTFGSGLFSPVASAVEINIYANNETNAAKAKVSEANSVKLAIVAMRAVKKHVANMPDGTLLSNVPAIADGKSESRIKLYEKAGFAKSSGMTMYAVVKDGKIVPASLDYIKANFEYMEIDVFS